MVLLNQMLRKCTGDYKFSRLEEKSNPQMYMEINQAVCKKRKRIGDSRKNNKNIQQGYRNEILQRKMGYAHNKKRKKTNNGRNKTNKSRKNA